MTFTQDQIWQSCKKIAPNHSFDPHLVMGVNEQECDHPNDDLKLYDAAVTRLEENYYLRYTRKLGYSSTMEAKLAISWGVMQMMGESLRECKNSIGHNYFEWYYQNADMLSGAGTTAIIINPYTPYAFTAALDYYCVNTDVMIEWGCLWLVTKRTSAGGDIRKMLQLWNGGGNINYASEVLTRVDRLKKELT